MEDEDGEVVKTYELPSQKPEGQEGNALFGNSLKMMGLGGLTRGAGNAGKAAESSMEEGEAATPGEATRVQSKSGWPGFGVLGGSSAQNKKKQPEVEEDGDDKKIRFTIGGVGNRLTKEEFIKQMQQLDAGTRQAVVNQSNAPQTIKTIAKQDPPPEGKVRSVAVPDPRASPSRSDPSASSSSGPSRRRSEQRTPSPAESPADADNSHDDLAETAVERKRRLAVLSAQGADDDEGEDTRTGETPAERRRRQAALGTVGEDDSEDEGTERVPPARRGIRFAPEQERGRR